MLKSQEGWQSLGSELKNWLSIQLHTGLRGFLGECVSVCMCTDSSSLFSFKDP